MSSADSARNDVTNKSEHLRRVREAAEALFKPKVPEPPRTIAPPAAVVSKPSTLAGDLAQPGAVIQEAGMHAGATAEPAIIPEPSTRLARLLPVKKPQPIVTGTASDVKPKIIRNEISISEHSRIRVLTSYGMTCAQVAALYDVTIDAIEKILF